jgi:hypothetical protein
MLLVLLGVMAGILLNPALPGPGPLWRMAPYIAFNLLLALGLRDLW